MNKYKNIKSVYFFIFCNLVLLNNISAQSIVCNTISAEMNYTVASVKIMGRWLPSKLQQKVDELIGVGQLFDPAKVGLAEELVRKQIVDNERIFTIRLLGSTSVLFITSDICPIADSTNSKKVAIVIHSYYLRIDLYNLGNNILPIPRTAKPTFYNQVPSILLATAPNVAILNDSRFGTSGVIQTTTDLFHIPGIAKSSGSTKKLRLCLSLNLRKSFNNSFYNFATVLQLFHPVYADTTLGWSFGIMYTKAEQPMGINNYNNNFTRFFGVIEGNGKGLFFTKYTIGGSVGFSQNKYLQQTNKFQNAETDYVLNAFSEGRIAKGLSRWGIWFNTAIPGNDVTLKPYHRVACKFGYAVSLGSGHSNVDMETILSYGYTWKTPPGYNEYFAGNAFSNFLYTPLNSFINMPFPQGPVIRSLGEKEGGIPARSNGISGGTSYWGMNLTFSIPVTKWARPLIPDIVIQESPRRITLRKAIKGQVTTAKSAIADDLALNGGLSDDEADATADRIVNKDIKPTINYLADQANIYSVKPVIFFDAGQLKKRNIDNLIWTAAGLGLQINVVNARLEIGYIQTLLPKSDDSKGNFLIRFLVQNFY